MITSLIATFVLGAQSAQLPKLELSFAAISFRNLAPTIEKQTGWKVKLNPEVENEIIGIRTAGRPTEEILKKIGETTFTTWIVKDGELKVEIDSKAREAEFQKSEDAFWKGIAKERADHLKLAFEKKYVDSEGNVETYEPEPSEVLLATQIQGITLSELRGLGNGERVVFALNPNRKQRSLRTLNAQAVSQAYAIFVEDSESYNVDENESESYARYLKETGYSDSKRQAEYAAIRPVGLLLGVSRFGSQCISFELTMVDQLNRSHYITSQEIYNYSGYREPPPDILKRDGDSILLTPSKQEVEILKVSEMEIDDLIHFRLPKNTAEILLNPDVYEPMLYEGGELMHQAAQKRDIPQIVSFSDDFAIGYEDIKDIRDLRESLQDFRYNDDMQNGWWSIRPTNMLSSWSLRIDRRDLQKVIAIDEGNSTLPVDRVAEFAFKYPLAEENCFISTRLGLFAELNSEYAFLEKTLRIFGGLSAAQRENLRRGGRVPISQVPRSVLTLIEQMTFGTNGTLVELSANSKIDVYGLVSDPSDWDIYALPDPTSAFPNGLLQGGYLELKRQSGKYMIPKSDDPLLARCFWALTREDFFMYSMAPEQKLIDRYGANPAYGRMCVGDYEELQLNVVLAPGLGHSGRFKDYTAPRDSKSYSMFDPPAAIRNQVSQDYAEIERAPYGSAWLRWRREASGNGGRTKRDPPPGASDLPENQG